MNTASVDYGHCRRLISALSATTFLLGGLVLSPHAANAQASDMPRVEQSAPNSTTLKAPKVVLTRTDRIAAPKVGDRLTFDLRVTNENDVTATVFPRLSNMSEAAFEDDSLQSCRWINMPGNDAYSCTTAYHIVTEEDFKQKSFTPEIRVLFSKDHLGLEPLSDEVTYKGEPIEILHDTELKPLEVKIKRSDQLSTPARLQNRLTFEIEVTNPNNSTVNVTAGSSNLDGFTYTGLGNSCRYIGLGPNASFTCALPAHVVTLEDVQKGTFTPEVELSISADTEGRSPLRTTKMSGDAIQIQQNPNSHAPYNGAFKVEWIRVDEHGDTAHVGETLRWQLRVTNTTNIPLTSYPVYTNAHGVLVDRTPNCRWVNLGAHETYYCDTVEHKVTMHDIKQGSFTPFVLLDGIDPNNVQNTPYPGVMSKGDTVKISAERRSPDTGARPIGRSIQLAKAGDHNFPCHRIPALTAAPNGDLLAAWDGRPEGCPDSPGANSIVQRISKDGGQTWGEAKVIAQGNSGSDKHGYSDPSFVVDREQNKIFMFFVKSFDQGLLGSTPGVLETNRNVLHAAVMESSDNGVTWSTPKVITSSITNDVNTWRSRFASSGEGIQLKHGAHKGRLVQQFTVITGSNINPKANFQAVSVYSDDHGKTWKAGQPFGSYMDENKVVELADGRLMLNSRSSGNEKFRKVGISEDGGETWKEIDPARELVDPQNNASIIRAYPDAPPSSDAAKVLLFSNARDARARRHGAISVSYDEGKTWTHHRFFAHGSMSYSTLTHMRDAKGNIKPGEYGLLYEGETSEIRYVTIDDKWLGIDKVSKDPKRNEGTDPKNPETNPDSAPSSEPLPPNRPQPPSQPAPPGNAPAPRPVPPPAAPAPRPAPPAPAPQAPAPQAPAPRPAPPEPSPEPQGPRSVSRVAGETRFETAINLSRSTFRDGQASTVILARADVAADSVSAVPLAKALNAPVLLTPQDTLHPGVQSELRRVMAPGAKVILMGGEAALSNSVQQSVSALGATVDRVAGANRAATAVATAQRLDAMGKAKAVLLADGSDWQVDLIAGPAAAKVEGVTLLTNGATMAPETAAYLAQHQSVPVTGIGVHGAAQSQATTKVVANDPTSLSIAVAQQFFPQTAAVGVATTADFADALAGGAHIAHQDGPMVLVPTTTPPAVNALLDTAKVRRVTVYGGPTRITNSQLEALTQ